MRTDFPTIGIIGGVGPQAGADFFSLLTQMSTQFAHCDQQHLPVLLFSLPALIPDRSAWLAHRSGANPAEGLVMVAEKAIQAGASILAIPCNTIHAPPIFAPYLAHLRRHHPQVTQLHLIDEVARLAARRRWQRCLLLATPGTYQSDVYADSFGRLAPDSQVIYPNQQGRDLVEQAIYAAGYGIKSCSRANSRNLALIEDALECCSAAPEAVILGCTELSLLAKKLAKKCPQFEWVDSSAVLATAVIASCRAQHPVG